MITFPNWTPIFFVVYGKACGEEWTLERHTFYDEISLGAQNVDTILGSVVKHNVEDLCDGFKRKRMLTLT